MNSEIVNPKVSLDQWRAFQAVVEFGGFAQAAAILHRSQSSVSYAVNRLQEQLGIKLLEIEGRKAVLNEAGKVLFQRSKQLVSDASIIEQQAHYYKQGWEAEIHLAVETAFPTELILKALKIFEPIGKNTRIHLEEFVLSGAEDLLSNGQADLLITPFVPKGYLGDELLQVNFVAVAHPDHPLHKLERELSVHDLERETHVVVSESGNKDIDLGWISDSQRWSVTTPESAHKIISNGLGYGWLPDEIIEDQLAKNELKVLPLNKGQRVTAPLYLVFAEDERVGPATRKLAEILVTICESFKFSGE